jgi:hypothetical protein
VGLNHTDGLGDSLPGFIVSGPGACQGVSYLVQSRLPNILLGIILDVVDRETNRFSAVAALTQSIDLAVELAVPAALQEAVLLQELIQQIPGPADAAGGGGATHGRFSNSTKES